jgi:hypothetical protein
MSWRKVIITIAVLSLVGLTFGAVAPQTHPYRRQYVKDTFGRRALAGAGVRAGINQARNSPKEWGSGPAGFGKRLASGMGTHVVNNTIRFGVAAARHEDLHYYRSHEKGFGPRMRHALVSTVVTRKTTTGHRTVAAGRISGAMGSGLISRAWQPAAARTIGGGLASGGITLGASAGANVAREFWPRKHRGLHHR